MVLSLACRLHMDTCWAKVDTRNVGSPWSRAELCLASLELNNIISYLLFLFFRKVCVCVRVVVSLLLLLSLRWRAIKGRKWTIMVLGLVDRSWGFLPLGHWCSSQVIFHSYFSGAIPLCFCACSLAFQLLHVGMQTLVYSANSLEPFGICDSSSFTYNCANCCHFFSCSSDPERYPKGCFPAASCTPCPEQSPVQLQRLCAFVFLLPGGRTAWAAP